MNPRIRPIAIVLVGILALTACTGRADLQAQALARWKAYCASKGKQFLWHDTLYDQGLAMHSVQITGRCVGPGDKGYQPPLPAGDEP